MEDVSVSGNVKSMRKNLLFYSSYVVCQYLLGNKIGERHNFISLSHSSLHLMAGVSKDSKTTIKAIVFSNLYNFSVVRVFLSVGRNFVQNL